MHLDCASCKNKNEIGYVLIDARRIFKDFFMIPLSNWERLLYVVERET